MSSIDNQTAYAAAGTWVRDVDGAETWIVVVKATFDVAPDGSTSVAEAQAPVLRLPEWTGEPGNSVLAREADLVLTKPGTDVLVHAAAHSPEGRAVAELHVGMRVGPLRKVLRVTGDRVWDRGRISSPVPFVRMPVAADRAYGGIDAESTDEARAREWRNPAGVGFVADRARLDGVRLPNVEYRHEPIVRWDDRPVPAHFGPVPSHWPQRAIFAGTYDERWAARRQPLLPDDFDPRFFHCATEDQQVPGGLSGGEPVALRHLTPGGAVDFVLPRLIFGIETHFLSGPPVLHRARLHTVEIDAETSRVSLAFHSALRCHARARSLVITSIVQKHLVRFGAQDEEIDDVENV